MIGWQFIFGGGFLAVCYGLYLLFTDQNWDMAVIIGIIMIGAGMYLRDKFE